MSQSNEDKIMERYDEIMKDLTRELAKRASNGPNGVSVYKKENWQVRRHQKDY